MSLLCQQLLPVSVYGVLAVLYAATLGVCLLCTHYSVCVVSYARCLMSLRPSVRRGLRFAEGRLHRAAAVGRTERGAARARRAGLCTLLGCQVSSSLFYHAPVSPRTSRPGS